MELEIAPIFLNTMFSEHFCGITRATSSRTFSRGSSVPFLRHLFRAAFPQPTFLITSPADQPSDHFRVNAGENKFQY